MFWNVYHVAQRVESANEVLPHGTTRSPLFCYSSAIASRSLMGGWL